MYFLLVDLLEFEHFGIHEKVAWSIPVDLDGETVFIEHRKLGLGIFIADGSCDESVAAEVVELINKGVRVARPYFDWRADQSLKGSNLNVTNDAVELFERFEYLASLFDDKLIEAIEQRGKVVTKRLKGGGISYSLAGYHLEREADWLALATIEGFFSWTEHVFVHLAILQGSCKTGLDVDELAGERWRDKFKKVLDITDPQVKHYYDDLVAMRSQVRNVEAHGSFGKNGEAFHFHSGAGAVPVMLPHLRNNRTRDSSAQDSVKLAREFSDFLRTGPTATALIFLESGLDTRLSGAVNGEYKVALASEEDMRSFIEYREYIEDAYTNMDF